MGTETDFLLYEYNGKVKLMLKYIYLKDIF